MRQNAERECCESFTFNIKVKLWSYLTHSSVMSQLNTGPAQHLNSKVDARENIEITSAVCVYWCVKIFVFVFAQCSEELQ